MRRYILFALLLIFTTVFSEEVKVPEITFPIEIIAEKKEEKPLLSPPENISLKEKLEIKLFVEEFKPIPPYTVNPPVLNLKKPSTFLGIPEENALMSGAVEDFQMGRLFSAKEKLETLTKKYPEVEFINDAYYLLGIVYYRLEEYKKALENFSKGCSSKNISKVKDYSCISAVILNLRFHNLKEAENMLKNIDLIDDNSLFWHSVLFAHLGNPKEAQNLAKDINCEDLDINFVEYCRYIKGYLLFATHRFKEALEVLKNIDIPTYYRHLLLLKGFSYLNLNELSKATAYFNKFLEGYGSVEKISDYAIYGLGIIDIKTGNIKKAIEDAGILEVRNPELSQNLYIKIAEELADRKDFINAFVILQKSVKTGNRYIDYLRKKIAVTAYNTGNYQYAFLMFKDINQPEFFLYAGYALLKLNRPVQAKEYFEKAYRLAEKNQLKETALKFLADIYFQLRQFREYLNVVKLLKSYDQEYASNLLGWYFFVKKEYQKAYLSFKDPYMKAVSAFNGNMLKEAYQIIKDKTDRKYKFLLAYIYLKEEQLDKARKVLKELSRGNDKIAEEAGYLYAYSYFSQQKYLQAAQAFKEFAQKYENTRLGKLATLRMADSYYNAGNIEKARQIYRQFIQKYSNSPEAIDAAYQLTILEMKSSEGDVAQQINSFIQKYPNYPFVNLLKLQLADYYLEKQEYEKAEEIYKHIIVSDSKESDYAFYKLGYMYYIKKDLENAIKTLTDYIKKHPNGKYVANGKTLLVKIYDSIGDYEKAISLLKQLPNNDENIFKLAVLYYKKKDLLKAKEYFEDIYTRFPKYRNDIAYYLGKIQMELGHTDMAKKFLQEAIGGTDYFHTAESYFLLGVIAEKEGNKEEALNSYINVIYLYPEAKEFVIKARLKAAEIMKKEGQKKEAACMLKPLKNEKLTEKLNEQLNKLIEGLPECR